MQKVLLIDDAPELHEIVAEWLRDEDVHVFSSFDAADDLAKASELQPDVILLDVDMPVGTALMSAAASHAS